MGCSCSTPMQPPSTAFHDDVLADHSDVESEIPDADVPPLPSEQCVGHYSTSRSSTYSGHPLSSHHAMDQPFHVPRSHLFSETLMNENASQPNETGGADLLAMASYDQCIAVEDLVSTPLHHQGLFPIESARSTPSEYLSWAATTGHRREPNVSVDGLLGSQSRPEDLSTRSSGSMSAGVAEFNLPLFDAAAL